MLAPPGFHELTSQHYPPVKKELATAAARPIGGHSEPGADPSGMAQSRANRMTLNELSRTGANRRQPARRSAIPNAAVQR